MPDQNCLTWSTQSCTFWFELLAGAAETVTATRSTARVVSTREVLILRTFVREGKEEARSEARLSMSVGNGHARGRISVFHAGPKKDRKRQAEGWPGESAVRGTHVGECRTVLSVGPAWGRGHLRGHQRPHVPSSSDGSRPLSADARTSHKG